MALATMLQRIHPAEATDGKLEERFVPGVSFRQVADFYVFDKRLRLAALDALERIEVAARSEIANCLGAKDRLAHRLRADFLSPWGEWSHWLRKHDSRVRQSGKDAFVRHHKDKYYGHLPIWASVELWDFGMTSHFYSGMKGVDFTAGGR